MVEQTKIAIRESSPMALPEESTFRAGMQAVVRFQQIVHSCMVQGHDYGIIPGTQKPTLLKPGAEKIAKLLGLADTYEILDKSEDWQRPFFRYMVKCRLVNVAHNTVISEGLGECNSLESKYRWRWVFGSDVPDEIDKSKLRQEQKHSKKNNRDFIMYRLENEDIYSQVNTILKMAKKRALVDAALSAGRLSDVFTQDVEDMAKEQDSEDVSVPEPTPQTATTAPAKPSEPRTKPVVKDPPGTVGELMMWALSHGKEFNSSWVCAQVNARKPEDIGDVAEAYQGIKAICGW
jgi:hypothetical protein